MSDNENKSAPPQTPPQTPPQAQSQTPLQAQSQTPPQARSQKKNLSDSEKKRIELVKHITVLCFGASAGAYIILGITIGAKADIVLDGRTSILLGALALFLMAIFAGAVVFSEHITKDMSFYNIKEIFMIGFFLFGLILFWLYIVTISWAVATITFSGVVPIIFMHKYHDCKYKEIISFLIFCIVFAILCYTIP